MREMFQFTHPCGCDGKPYHPVPGIRGFNSRTRVGATNDPGKAERLKKVSIHAPVWVRQATCPHDNGLSRFNSRTRVGATPNNKTNKTKQ